MKVFWKRLFGESGMSMAEVMIASALAGGLALVIAQIGKNSGEVSKRADTKSSMNMLAGQIGARLSDPTSCENTFGSTLTSANLADPNLTGATSGTGISLVSLGVAEKGSTNIFLTKTGKFAEITLTDMRLRYVSVANQSGQFYVTGTYKLSGKTVSIKPIMMPVNLNTISGGWNTSSSCSVAGNFDNIWKNTAALDGIYYDAGIVYIGNPESPTSGSMLDINTNGSLWSGSTTIFKGIELNKNNYMIWKNGTTDTYGMGYYNDGTNSGFAIQTYAAGRPSGIRNKLSFNDVTRDVSISTSTNLSIITSAKVAIDGVLEATWCTYAPSVCNSSLPTNIFGSSDSYQGGIGFNAITVANSGGVNTAGYNTGFATATGNGGAMILADNDSAAALKFYSFPSTSTTATQNIPQAPGAAVTSIPDTEVMKIDANKNAIIGNVRYTTASGNPSFVAGGGSGPLGGGRAATYQATATGLYSSNLGWYNRIGGNYSVGIGDNNITYGQVNVALGEGNIAGASASPNHATIGFNSMAFGTANFVDGRYAGALGYLNNSRGESAFSIGSGNISSGANSVALGQVNLTSGLTSIAGGYYNTASGMYSVALGYNNTASGNYAISMGSGTTAIGSNSVSIGTSNTAAGANARSFGYSSDATGNYSFAAGNNGIASGANSLAISTGNVSATASGVGSIALGTQVTASGSAAVAIGDRVTAAGNNSLAWGTNANVIAGATDGLALGVNSRVQHANATVLTNSSWATINSSATMKLTVMFYNGMEFCNSYNASGNCNAGMYMPANGLGSGWNVISDRNLKKDIVEFDEEEENFVLNQLDKLPLSTWAYKSTPTDRKSYKRNIGPMAQDFNQLFSKKYNFSSDDKGIATNDIIGINLVATKALKKENVKLKQDIASLEERIKILEELILKKK